MDAYHILVIILSAALAVLLVLAIVATVLVIKLLKQVRHIIEKAEGVMDNVETVSEFFKKTAGPVAITTLISNIVSKVTQHKNKGK